MWRSQFSSVVVLVHVVIVGSGGVWNCVEGTILFCGGAGNCGSRRKRRSGTVWRVQSCSMVVLVPVVIVGSSGVWYCVEKSVFFCSGVGACCNSRKRWSLELCGECNLVLWWCWQLW